MSTTPETLSANRERNPMSDLDKILRVHNALVRAGVDPEYARVQLKHQADQLGTLSPAEYEAQLALTPRAA